MKIHVRSLEAAAARNRNDRRHCGKFARRRMHHRRPIPIVVFGTILTALAVVILAGCEEPVSPTSQTPTTQPPPPDDYAGHYLGVGTSVRVSLSLGKNSFDATVLSPRRQAASSRFRASVSDSQAATWVMLQGDVVVSGQTVKASVTGVTRDGQELIADDVAAYSRCLLEASVTVAGELVRDLLDCLGLRDSQATVLKTEAKPSDLLLGTWRFEESNESSSRHSSGQLRIGPTSGVWSHSYEWCGGGPYSPEPEPVTDHGPRLSILPELVMEGATAVFTVTLSPTANAPVTVNWSTTDERIFPVTYGDGVDWEQYAVAGIDYTPAKGTLTFQPGQVSQTFSIATLDDSAVEGEEVFRVVLSDAEGAAIVGPGVIGVIIDPDDWPCLVVEATFGVEIMDTYFDVHRLSSVVIGPDGERVELPSPTMHLRVPYVIDRGGERLTITSLGDLGAEFYWRFIKEEDAVAG